MRGGLGWRRDLGAAILANLDAIEVVEVMAEDFVHATRAQQRAMRYLREHVSVILHATSLGLASTEPVDAARLDAVARVIDWLEPELWSEHLAFVRGGGVEVGHLAAPPRNDATLEGLVRNVDTAARVTGSKPLLENVASLVEPPLCAYGEAEWLNAVLDATRCELLLDLHNLHANAANFGFDARAVVRSLPHDRVRVIHLAGGKRIERGRLLDDHKHPVPDAVYELLREMRNGDVMVVLERDGEYPAIEELLAELARARQAMGSPSPAGPEPAERRPSERMVIPDDDVIARLARLYTSDDELARFLAAPDLEIDRDDLMLAARSFARKRAR